VVEGVIVKAVWPAETPLALQMSFQDEAELVLVDRAFANSKNVSPPLSVTLFITGVLPALLYEE
jgi:hypothetical protein